MSEIHAVRLFLSHVVGKAKCKGGAQVETEKSNNLYLYIDLPRFDFPIIFSELVRLHVVTAHTLP